MNTRWTAAFGRSRPVAAGAGFSTWHPAMLDRTAGFGQKRTFIEFTAAVEATAQA